MHTLPNAVHIWAQVDLVGSPPLGRAILDADMTTVLRNMVIRAIETLNKVHLLTTMELERLHMHQVTAGHKPEITGQTMIVT